MAPTAGAESATLYVHVPFCVVKCGYCDFTSYVVDDQRVHDQFLAALDAELGHTVLPRDPASVFVGGGTPSHLSAQRLAGLFEILNRHVDLRSCGEVTMEANPESIDVVKARLALDAGVNRFSMGVQSFDAARLRFLDRAHSGDRARAAFGELRAAGATNVSIDLIFGVPGETEAEWATDLAAALELEPDHLSCYSLTFEPGTRLHRDLQQGRCTTIAEEIDRRMFLRTRQVLGDAGFHAYEISNFAGRGGPCRHNDHYWLQGDYVGVGPGAASHRQGVRSTNLKTIDRWVRAALAGEPTAASAEVLPPQLRLGEAVWLGLRRTQGIDLERIEARIGYPLEPLIGRCLVEHQRRGWIERTGSSIRLTPDGLLFADSVSSDYLVSDTAAPADRSDAERESMRQHLG